MCHYGMYIIYRLFPFFFFILGLRTSMYSSTFGQIQWTSAQLKWPKEQVRIKAFILHAAAVLEIRHQLMRATEIARPTGVHRLSIQAAIRTSTQFVLRPYAHTNNCKAQLCIKKLSLMFFSFVCFMKERKTAKIGTGVQETLFDFLFFSLIFFRRRFSAQRPYRQRTRRQH